MGSMGKFLGSLYFHFQQEVCFQSLGGPGVVGFCLDQFFGRPSGTRRDYLDESESFVIFVLYS